MTDLKRPDNNDEIHTEPLKRAMSAFQLSSRKRSIWQLINTLIPYASLWILANWALGYSFWLALPVIALASGFMTRAFIIFHDCGHQSFFHSRKANDFWGVVTGILTFTPYYFWRRNHALHHATSGNLDKRGYGDVWTMTANEYRQSSRGRRLKYRLYRNPLVMFFLGPLLLMLITHRIPGSKASPKERRSIYGNNLGILLMAVPMSLLIGLKAYLLIQFLILFIGLIGGIWLFYVQHQFEDVYWARDGEWKFAEASLKGASFYKLPLILNWFTGNIGYHHIHHLNPGIPNYNLPKCQRKIPGFEKAKSIKLIASLKSLKYRLWDEEQGRLIGFREAKYGK